MRRLWPGRMSGAQVRMLGSGQLDAGFAALAGFIASALAVRLLPPEELGVFALLFMAFGVASQIPTQLVLSPAEVIIAHLPKSQRLGSIRWSLPRGTVVAALGSVGVAAGALPLAGSVELGTMAPLILTAVTFTLISPVQDHIRRVLHAAEMSGRASAISAANLATTAVSAVALLQVDPLWVPFGAMTIGNVLSCCLVVFFAWGSERSTVPTTRELVSIGRHLLVVGLGNAGGGYLAGTMVGTLAGPAALGYYEAARLVARPSEVSAMGVLAGVGPRLMVASANRDAVRVKSLNRTYYSAVLAIGIIYMVFVATPLGWGIPRNLFPTAYEIGGLVLATLVAQLLISMTRPMQTRLMGLRAQSSLAIIEMVSQGGRLVASVSAMWLGAFALPVGASVASVVKLVRYRSTLQQRESSTTHSESAAVEGDMRSPRGSDEA